MYSSFINKLLLLNIVCLILSNAIFAQDFSNKGKDFWVGYGSHVSMYNGNGDPNTTTGGSQNMVLYFTSDRDANVKVEIPSLGYTKTYIITANSVTVSDPMPKLLSQDARITDEGKSDKGIHITSDFAIIAYAHIYDGSVSGATLLLPTNTLGRSYYSINYKQISNSPNSYSYAYVIATEDSTNIEITPSANTKFYGAGDVIRVTLNKGQIYNIFGRELSRSNNASTGEDLTGTLIRSIATATSTCKRIAVFSGSGKISIFDNNARTADNYIQQALPANAWGKKYLTVPTAKMANNIFRIAVSDPNAVVKLNGNVLATSTLINNFYYEFNSFDANSIESNVPIMVAQYITTSGSYGNTNSGNGDPEMIYLSPIEQTINKVTINSTSNARIVDSLHFVNIVLPKNGASSLLIDGKAPANPIVHPGDPNYVYYQVALKSGAHTIIADSGFNAFAYGYGGAESYGYNAGTNVTDLYQRLTVNNQYGTVKLPATCRGTPFKVSITLPYQPLSLAWNIPKYPNIPVNNAPAYDSTYQINGKTIYRYSLNTYLIYDSVGTYNIQIKVFNPTGDGCSGEQTIDFDLVVYSPPKAAFKMNTSNCLGDSVVFNDNTLVNENDRKLISFNWKIDNGSYVDAKKLAILANKAGIIPFNYYVITDIGCLSDTISANFIVDSIPKVDFVAQQIKCLGKDIVFKDSSFARNGTQLLNWVWNYGDNSVKDSLLTNSPVTHKYDTAKNYNVSLAVTTLNGCRQQKTASIKVSPNPKAGFVLPEICLNDAFAEFKDTSSIVDNSNGFRYKWDFGDALNTSASNTDSVANPKHKYLNAGNYQVKETVTSLSGCVGDTIEIFTVNGAYPKSNFTIIDSNAICTNVAMQLNNASTVDIGSIGKVVIYWDYANNKLDTSIDENPSLNKIYKHSFTNFKFPDKMQYDIRLVSYSGITCFDEAKSLINLVPPPQSFSFSASKEYACVADSILFTPNIVGGTPEYSYVWTTSSNDAKFNQNVLTGVSNGSVNISLKVTDAKNCIYQYNNIKNLEIKTIPVATIKAIDTIICNQDPITIKGSGGSQYNWFLNKKLNAITFVDSFQTANPGYYQLQVNNGFCNSLLSDSIYIYQYIIPPYSFSTKNYVCINTSFPITTNAKEAKGTHFLWNFGDSSFSELPNPLTHKYSKYGSYQIKLSFTNDYCPKYDSFFDGDSIKVVDPLKASEFTMFVLSDMDTVLSNIKIDSGYTKYEWAPYLNLSNPMIANPVFRATNSMDYTLSRTDTSSFCKVDDIYHIIVSNEVVVSVPKAFTPNNDGLNDVLKLETGAGVKLVNYFRIFNRWGKLIFETNNPTIGWDGKYNGREQEMDAYTYLLDYITFKEEHVSKTGSVILLR
jgi:gliding motility-associated-like protein